MRRFEKKASYLHADDLTHIRDEFRRHASASTISASFLTMISSPVIFLNGLETISLKYVLIACTVFLFFSILPDVIRFFCNIAKLDTINAISHSFIGALLFPGLLALALLPLDIWAPPLFVLGLLGYLVHLFVDSAESAMEWWINGIQRVLATPPFESLKKSHKRATQRP